MERREAEARIRALGFDDDDTQRLVEHFEEAELRGKTGHGWSRVPFLEGLDGYDPRAAPVLEVQDEAYWRYDANGAIGYLTLRAAVDAVIAAPPAHARVVVVRNCFPTGMLGHYARRLAGADLVGVLTATSPRRLAHPDGGPKLTGTNPLAIGIPSSDGRPVVVDVSMGKVTHGDVLAGLAAPADLVPFGGDSAHKAFALAVGLQLVVESLAGAEHGAVLVVARPESDPVPAFRALAEGVRLPGD